LRKFRGGGRNWEIRKAKPLPKGAAIGKKTEGGGEGLYQDETLGGSPQGLYVRLGVKWKQMEECGGREKKEEADRLFAKRACNH